MGQNRGSYILTRKKYLRDEKVLFPKYSFAFWYQGYLMKISAEFLHRRIIFLFTLGGAKYFYTATICYCRTRPPNPLAGVGINRVQTCTIADRDIA